VNGSVFKRYPCSGKHDGKGNGKTCKKEHGSWYFVRDLSGDRTGRPRVKRGGFATKPEAEAELTKSMSRYGQRGIAAERNLKAGRHRAHRGRVPADAPATDPRPAPEAAPGHQCLVC
jgi:hypothetical protein